MKICVVGLRGIPGVMGGVETHCEELLPRIAAENDDLDIEVCGRSPYLPHGSTEFRNVKVKALPSPTGKSTEAIVSTLAGIAYARRTGARLVHIHAVGPAILAPLARLLGLKVVFTHHGADYDRAKWGRFAKFSLKGGEWAGMRFANRIICVAPSLRTTMVERYRGTSGKTLFIPNGATPLPSPPADDYSLLGEYGLADGKYALTVARLVPEKGLDYLIEAHNQSGIDEKLVIAGAEMHGDEYAANLRAKASGSVIFTGALPREKLAVLYRSAGLFVLPSFHEGLPIAALEALAAGCPVALSDIQPNRDLGLDSGHYFAVGNTGDLARLLKSDWKKLKTDQSAVLDRFDWERIAHETAGVYHSLDTHKPLHSG